MRILVKCEFVIPIEVPDDEDYDVRFDIEENHCPGTGIVGAAIDKLMKDHEKNHTCWACAVRGENTIVGWDEKPKWDKETKR